MSCQLNATTKFVRSVMVDRWNDVCDCRLREWSRLTIRGLGRFVRNQLVEHLQFGIVDHFDAAIQETVDTESDDRQKNSGTDDESQLGQARNPS